MHSVTLTLTTKNECDWSTAFSLLTTVALDAGTRFDVSVSSHDNEDIPDDGEVIFTENTVRKVLDALIAGSHSEDEATDLINSLHNAGILFRERKS